MADYYLKTDNIMKNMFTVALKDELTANAFVEDMRKTKEAGMNEHLTKPVDGEKLLQVLYKYKKTGL